MDTIEFWWIVFVSVWIGIAISEIIHERLIPRFFKKTVVIEIDNQDIKDSGIFTCPEIELVHSGSYDVTRLSKQLLERDAEEMFKKILALRHTISNMKEG